MFTVTQIYIDDEIYKIKQQQSYKLCGHGQQS